MEKIKFKSNFKCSGCVDKVKPILDAEKGIEKWEVDLNDSNKVLTVESNDLNIDQLVKEIESVGFKIEKI